MQKLLIALCLAVIGGSFNARAQSRTAGYIDTDFFAACFGNPVANTLAKALAVQPDGRILAGGNFTLAGGFSCVNAVGRLLPNGATDTTFRSPFITGDFVNALALQGDGKIVVGGRMRDDDEVFAVARLNANGSIDRTFIRTIDATLTEITSVALQPDGKVIAVGAVHSATPPFGRSGYIVRLNTRGSVDGTFANGVVTPLTVNGEAVSAVAVQALDKILVGGSFETFRNVARPGLVQLGQSGSVNLAFNPQISDGDVRALLVQPDGRIVVAGLFTADGVANRCVTRLNADGSRDTSFASLSGFGTRGLSLAQQTDGKILLGHHWGVLRLNTNGTIDTTFSAFNAAQSLGTEADMVESIALGKDDKVLVGALAVRVSGAERRSVVRLFGDVPPPPVIVQHPASLTVAAGTNVTFSVIATGAPPVRFQWRKNNKNLRNATNSTLTLPDVDSTDGGNYSVVVTNIGGAVTSTVARLSVDFNTSELTLLISGSGTVTPNLNGRNLEIGRTYFLTAKSASGHVLSNWTGTVTSNAPVLGFVMESNMVIQANFVPSPFIPLKGTYNGLFFNTAAPASENAGSITLKLDERGNFRGTLRNATASRPIAGTVRLDWTTRATTSGAATPWDVDLQLDPATMRLSGVVSNAGFTAELVAVRSAFSGANPTPLAGNYNVALPLAEDAAGLARGHGFATIGVSATGRASGRGTLGDGSAARFLNTLGAAGELPVYLPLYQKRGSLFGWLTITNGDTTDVSGTLWWTRSPLVSGPITVVGFTNRIDTFGSRYSPTPPATPVLVLTNGVVILSGGGLDETIMTDITLGGDNRITGDNQLSLSISPRTGALSGSFADPDSNARRTVKGLALPKQNTAVGYFMGSPGTGSVIVGDR